MDAPQIAGRWPDRYASVLKDDPGCSVLTLTCLGISERTRNLKRYPTDKSRFVAFWNDPVGGPRELELVKDAGGLLLNLTLDSRDEWTIDLRHRKADAPRLVDYQQILLTAADEQKSLEIGRPCGAASQAQRSTMSPVEISTLSRLAWLSCLIDELDAEIKRKNNSDAQLKENLDAISDFFLTALSGSRRLFERRGKEIADCLVESTRGSWQQSDLNITNEDDLDSRKPFNGAYCEAAQHALRAMRKDGEGWLATIRARKQFIDMLKSWARFDL